MNIFQLINSGKFNAKFGQSLSYHKFFVTNVLDYAQIRDISTEITKKKIQKESYLTALNATKNFGFFTLIYAIV